MKVVILTTEQGNQVALCNKLSGHCEIAGIVLSKNVPRRSRPFKRRLAGFVSRASVRMFGRAFLDAWERMQREYSKQFPSLPDVPIVRVNNINDDATIEMLRKTAARLDCRLRDKPREWQDNGIRPCERALREPAHRHFAVC